MRKILFKTMDGLGKWCETQPETYDWGGPPKSTWGLPNGKGKGQGPKGEPYPKTDPWGVDFEPSDWALKIIERATV